MQRLERIGRQVAVGHAVSTPSEAGVAASNCTCGEICSTSNFCSFAVRQNPVVGRKNVVSLLACKTPEEICAALKEGNARYISGDIKV